jgi:hypothetical protein
MKKSIQKYTCDGCSKTVEFAYGANLIGTTDWIPVTVEILGKNKRATKKLTSHFCPLCQKQETLIKEFVLQAVREHRENVKS